MPEEQEPRPAAQLDFLRAQLRVLEMIANGESSAQTLAALVALPGVEIEGLACSISVLADDGKRCFAESYASGLPSGYLETLRGIAIAPPYQDPICQAVDQQLELVVDPLFLEVGVTDDRRQLLTDAGFNCLYLTPIFGVEKSALAVIVFYSRFGSLSPNAQQATAAVTKLAHMALRSQNWQSKLLASEQRFRATVDAVQGVLWTNNAIGEMHGDQPGWADLTGQTQAQYQGFGWSKAVHPDDVTPTIQAWNRSVAKRSTFEFEHRVRRRDGEWRTFSVRGVPSFAANGDVREWVGVHTDITLRKVAELEQATLAAVVKQSGDFIGFSDLAGMTSFINDAGLKMVGLEHRNDLHTISMSDLLASESKGTFEEAVLPAVSRHGQWSGELGLRNFETDVLIPVIYSLFELKNGQGVAVGYGSVVRDLRQHKRGEHALRSSEARFKAIFETVPVGIVIAEAPSGRIVGGNAQVEAILGHPLIESPDVESYSRWVSHHADGTRVQAHEYPLARALAGEPLSELEVCYQRGDGSKAWVRFIAAPIYSGNVITGALAASLDIDRERRALHALENVRSELELRVENEVRTREAAQAGLAHGQRMEALGQLAGGIAHDFNNVLQSVSGGLGLIQKRAASADEVRQFAKMASVAVARGASITARLLAFARKSELRAVRIDARDLLLGLREMLGSTLGPGISVDVVVPSDDAQVFADKAQLETVLVNLVVNARDAMPQGGKLLLSASIEDETPQPMLQETSETGYVRLEVKDSGAGMDAATLAHAAEPFFTTKAAGKGTGLGLAMARGFALQSGGGFSIASSVGVGTTVTMWLPLATAPVETNEDVTADALLGRSATSRKILLVDDDAMVRELLARQFIDAGHEVSQAADGLAAVELIDQGTSCDVLITDFSMPGMNGVSLVRELRRRHLEIPVLMLTGYADASLEPDLEAVGGKALVLLRKPIAGDKLLEAVESLFTTLN